MNGQLLNSFYGNTEPVWTMDTCMCETGM